MRNSPLRHALAVLRLEIGYKQGEMAKLVGCARATIQAVELGQLKLSETLANKIALATGVEFEWLIWNRMNEPIRLSIETSSLASQVLGREMNYTGYTREIFDLVQQHRQEKPDPRSIWGGISDGFVDYARLRAIVESARSRHMHELATYKVNKFLEELQAEFGFDEQVVDLRTVHEEHDPEAYEKASKFVLTEWSLAQQFKRVMHDERAPETIPEAEREVIETLKRYFTTNSPYAQNKVPTFAERFAKAQADDFADMEQRLRDQGTPL